MGDRYPAHAVIVTGSVIGPDDLAANYHRVDGESVHPTKNGRARRP
jgi:hypothetical protein